MLTMLKPSPHNRQANPVLRQKTNTSKNKINPHLVFLMLGLSLLILVGVQIVVLNASSRAGNQNHNSVGASNVLRKPIATTLPEQAAKASLSSDPTFAGGSLEKIRQEFYNRYGGEKDSKAMLAKGIRVYGQDSLNSTAKRMVQAVVQKRPFVLGFAGYSVTVGRGNFFHQSFPFVVERVLGQAFQQTFGIPLKVRNGAIGGIPSFPYGWCMDHFLGSDADVISWDYSMNEGKGASVMESYLRHGLMLPNRPMFIMLDTNRQRTSLLDEYANKGILTDAISVTKGEIVDKQLLEKPDEEKPPGFREWSTFGAPDSCPGRGSWHPKKMEHALIGWMIAMHLVEAAEHAKAIIANEPDWKRKYASLEQSGSQVVFPPPIANDIPGNDQSILQLMYGHEGSDPSKRIMKDTSCRTSFLPAVDENNVLSSVVVSGMADKNPDIMDQRSDGLYNSGWVFDVSDIERTTKKKVQKCGGLGYIDMKIALYGIRESGPLRMWLPFEGPSHDNHEPHDDSSHGASHWFSSVVVCEANEKRSEKACKLDSDIQYSIGGIDVPQSKVTSIDGAGLYLKRKTCYSIPVPAEAQVTRLSDVKNSDGKDVSPSTRSRLGSHNDSYGLLLDVNAVGRDVSRKNGACCISHVIWEQH